MRTADLVLVGGGTASLAAIQEALDLGVESIIVVDKGEELGGECAFNACVPTKTLLTASHYLHLIKHRFAPHGIEDINYRFHFGRLMQTVDHVIHEGELEFIQDSRVTVIKGEAHFSGKNTIAVDTEEGIEEITAKAIMIATGSTPIIPNIVGLDDVGFITFQQATHLTELPASLAIIGGGPVGVEFAQLFQTFGVQVTLLQKEARLLEHEEPEISQAIFEKLREMGVRVIGQVDIENIKCALKTTENLDADRQCALKLLNILTAGEPETIEVEQILVAVGMKPNIAGLRLSYGDVETTPKGAILVDDTLQTTNPNVWAIGDVVGQYQFTHVADYHAVIAVQNVIQKEKKTIDYWGIGWAIFTDPTIARVGLTEEEAKGKYASVQTVIVPTSEVSRYRIEGEQDGFIKLIVNMDSKQILGAHFFASHADDMVHVLMLAMRHKLTIEQVLDMCYIYPSKTQLIQKALEHFLRRQRTSLESTELLTPVL